MSGATYLHIEASVIEDQAAVSAISIATRLLVPAGIVLAMLRATKRLSDVQQRNGVEQFDWWCYLLSMIAHGAEIGKRIKQDLERSSDLACIKSHLIETDRSLLDRVLDGKVDELSQMLTVRDKMVFHFDNVLAEAAVTEINGKNPSPLAAFDGERPDKASTYFPLSRDCMVRVADSNDIMIDKMFNQAIALAGLAESLAVALMKNAGLSFSPSEDEPGPSSGAVGHPRG